jgi:hypothetical protein
MAFGIIGGLAALILEGEEGMKPTYMTLAGVDATNNTVNNLAIPERAFQFWPESFQDTIEVGWEFKSIPGASHAIAQWGSNNGRTFSFEVVLARFMKDVAKRNAMEKLLDPFGMTDPNGDKYHNVDVAAGIRYLRAYCYPLYKKGDKFIEAHPPPIAILNAPGMDLNEAGGDAVYAVMTGCDVTYKMLFPDGTPRLATVSLTFKQVVQDMNDHKVHFRGREKVDSSSVSQYVSGAKAYNGGGHSNHGVGPTP